ncbi:MAG TPA: ParA family protein [Candidatus Sulfotelmatobacter sp.]|nr:ParA family protein [Candidatus Sulfotelmatobacter sp.]
MAIKIAVASQKGGVGKSSCARLIAREFAEAGWKVKIADMDIQQGTSFHWCKERAANQVAPEIRAEAFASIKQALKDADNFDMFIMDGAPAASAATREMAKAADIVLLPTGLSNDDLRPQILLAHELTKAGLSAQKLFFVLWRVGDSDTEIQDAREYIAKAGYRALDGEVPDRTLYRRASDRGKAFTETTSLSLNKRADTVVQSVVTAIENISKTRAA